MFNLRKLDSAVLGSGFPLYVDRNLCIAESSFPILTCFLYYQFGASLAVGVDIDAEAIASAYQNAALNNIGPDRIQLQLIASENTLSSTGDGTSEVVKGENTSEIQTVTDKDKYDVVIANILLNPLLDNAEKIISCAKLGAIVALSGILSKQVTQLMSLLIFFLKTQPSVNCHLGCSVGLIWF